MLESRSCVVSPSSPCLQSEWTTWSACSLNCGSGQRFRYRSTVRRSTLGDCGPEIENVTCTTADCPIDACINHPCRQVFRNNDVTSFMILMSSSDFLSCPLPPLLSPLSLLSCLPSPSSHVSPLPPLLSIRLQSSRALTTSPKQVSTHHHFFFRHYDAIISSIV